MSLLPLVLRNFGTLLAVALLILIVSGCAPKVPGGKGEPLHQRLYIDARLGFAMELPGTWQRAEVARDALLAAAEVIAWVFVSSEQPGLEPRATVVLAPAGLDAASLAQALEQRLGARIAKEAEVVKLGGEELLRLHAENHQRDYLVYLVPAEASRFVVVFSAPSQNFKIYDKIFMEMIGSFEPLP